VTGGAGAGRDAELRARDAELRARDAELRARDGRGRRLALREFRRPIVLQAGAGTGKTTALVGRILAWIAGPGWERACRADPGEAPERSARRVMAGVVAITFTEAAAAEMSRRVGEALHTLEQGGRPLGVDEESLPPGAEVRRLRARALRGALDHLVVSTIHAWCRRLLAAHPFDAGLHSRLEVDADGRLRQEIVREVLEERLRSGYAAGEPPLLGLAARGVGPREIEAEILALLEAGIPARTFADDPFAEAPVRELGGRLSRAAEALSRLGRPLADLARAPRSREAYELASETLRRSRERPLADRDSLRELQAWLRERLGEPVVEKLRAWALDRLGVGESGALSGARAGFSAAAADLLAVLEHLRRIDVDRLDLGRAVFGELLGHVESELRSRGVVTFHDLVDGASRLLRERPAVADSLRSRIDQLLVDEFQDTDARQCDLLRALALRGPEEGRPGFFAVGDPKQSIYGWRSADLSAYDRFVDEVLEAGGLRESLSVNYRSVPAILDEVERVVAPVMRPLRGVQPPFEPLVPSPEHVGEAGFRCEGREPAEYWVSARFDPGTGSPRVPTASGEATRLEARALALDLCALHAAGVPWSSFGVLFRSRGDWDVYLGALREHQVPFAVEGDRSYFRRREIVDAAALVRCVLDPNDALAMLTLLRSAAVGVPDAALIPLWARDLPRRLAELERPDAERQGALAACAREVAAELPDGVPGLERVAGWEHGLVAFAEALAELRRSAREDAVDVFVEGLRTRVLLEASEAARYQGVWRVANLERFFRDLLADLCGGADFHRVLRRLRAAVAEERDAEEGRPQELGSDAVQIMTIHGAKGLDFEHVYLMQLHKGAPPHRPAQVEHRSSGGRLEYRVLGAPTAGWDRAERERAAVEEAERVRTLYVAATRARRRLVLAGLWPDFARGGSGRLVDLVDAALREGAGRPDLEAQASRGRHCERDARGARWVFPDLEPAVAAAARPAPARRAALPDAAIIAADSARLAAAAAAARERMRRPLGMAASDEPREGPEDGARRGGRARPGGGGTGGAPDLAAAVGTAVHRALEGFAFGGDPAAELARAREVARRSLEAELDTDRASAAWARSDALLERFARGPLLARLREIAPRIVARELPVLARPGPGDEAVGYVSGALDLVYADAGSGRLVVVDYKTGARGDHARQGARYTRALREALALDYEPRFELWYLEEDAVVPLDAPG